MQLAFVIPRLASGRTEGIELLLFEPFDSFLFWAITFPAATWLLAVHFGRIRELP